ncbi:hypothetical protein OESDEN_18878 [Oesophagostomum dentatum]|uniref:Glycosyltransferase family 92 protein n=1 Tax=Oesophagostomum dentatum TaxID=61180 RepID=A0A0B1SC19_OESDE|nr:hypothetical protein OESDEN_18878 [Oesophagostomum dentatum]
MFCRYIDEKHKEIGPPVPSVMFPEAIIYCCSRKNATFMSVTKGPDDPIVEIAKVLDRRRGDLVPRYFLSHCLAPIYGNERKWLMLVEHFEHFKLQGVEHFYVYIKEIDAYSKTVSNLSRILLIFVDAYG